ncbi:hypothetical protein BKA57DRAFT_444268 [Linnemannia elongata]|nr:hypothetical protein BKA57DRAFT_444268 [Linnemannia elongata]
MAWSFQRFVLFLGVTTSFYCCRCCMDGSYGSYGLSGRTVGHRSNKKKKGGISCVRACVRCVNYPYFFWLLGSF